METSEGVQLTNAGGSGLDMYDFPQSLVGQPSDRRVRKLQHWMLILVVLLIISLVLSIAALSYAVSENRKEDKPSIKLMESDPQKANTIKRIAFGSCTSHFVEPQPIWVEGVIKSEPDAWIWLGDFAYLDSTFLSCEDHKNVSQCFECVPSYLAHSPDNCLTGNLDHVLAKTHMQLKNPSYSSFLDYMCPGHITSGIFPPHGRDPRQCPRPILGVWDDHDYGWNNGNKRYPQKYIMKEIFLDAMGEAPDSLRRGSSRGIQFKEIFNSDDPDSSIDLFLLDERYHRDTLPCHMRTEWCTRVLQEPDSKPGDIAWCEDFLVTGGLTGGSCCMADDIWANGWCENVDPSHPYFPFACDPSDPQYGTRNLLQNEAGNITPTMTWQNVDQESIFCDMLGENQRKWLDNALRNSKAPVKIVASGSVLVGSPGFVSSKGPCSGDDWECYRPAQLNLIQKLGAVENGCVIVITGDYHFSDIKVLEPGFSNYSEHYQTQGLKRPIYQVMASGMTTETAKFWTLSEPCSDYRIDTLGTRSGSSCNAVFEPAFGMIEIDWERKIAKLQIRDSSDGSKVAVGYDGAPMELSIDLDTCLRL